MTVTDKFSRYNTKFLLNFYVLKRCMYWIPEKLKKDFEAAAAAHGWNLSQAIRQLMNQYGDHSKTGSKPPVKSFLFQP